MRAPIDRWDRLCGPKLPCCCCCCYCGLFAGCVSVAALSLIRAEVAATRLGGHCPAELSACLHLLPRQLEAPFGGKRNMQSDNEHEGWRKQEKWREEEGKDAAIFGQIQMPLTRTPFVGESLEGRLHLLPPLSPSLLQLFTSLAPAGFICRWLSVVCCGHFRVRLCQSRCTHFPQFDI